MKIDTVKALSNSTLNEICATKVMGWEKKRNGPFGTYYFNKDGSEVSHINHWNPTEDMNDAMALVGSMSDCLHLKQHGKEGTWESMFCGSGYDAVSADTAPLAICYASLLAFE